MGSGILYRKLTHEDVHRAVAQFLKRGGVIEQLPEQKSQENPTIGGEKYQDYESLAAIISA
ncbi:MAG: hypothetical protein O7A08_10850 [SAR324 cluster bacterium]|nr:hypothetical protein [SAR324 cluster bacterium]MCZ6533447.1 hypothetical protein [SAR324 cluster bacterium]MCZ6557119.1 hypothetical protein [SAR324 cluster bacterium]MCZ6627490.1 hypothetical protein [SAR324 cluster bacterium]MCZ6647411.1 hypothetical protein [SAR324 cluster bacterium]